MFHMNPTYQSPLNSRSATYMAQHSDPASPLDSQVPRTPNVNRQILAEDQNVPFTPQGTRAAHHESPGLSPVRVPYTPDMSSRLPYNNIRSPPLEMRSNNHAHFQGMPSSNTSTPSRSDQLVPSTPEGVTKTLQGANNARETSPATVSRLVVLPTCQDLFSLSPLQATSMVTVLCQKSMDALEDSGYMSMNSSMKDEQDSPMNIERNEEAQLSRNYHSVNSGGVVSPLHSTAQHKAKVSRKCPPPSRRKLSLCRDQPDLLRRTAHQNLSHLRSIISNSARVSVSVDVHNSNNRNIGKFLTGANDSDSVPCTSQDHFFLTGKKDVSGAQPCMTSAGDAMVSITESKNQHDIKAMIHPTCVTLREKSKHETVSDRGHAGELPLPTSPGSNESNQVQARPTELLDLFNGDTESIFE